MASDTEKTVALTDKGTKWLTLSACMEKKVGVVFAYVVRVKTCSV